MPCVSGVQRKSRATNVTWNAPSSSGPSPGHYAPRSAECERKRFHARVEELDLELSIDHGLRLTYQLVQALFGDVAVALLVYVDSVRFAGRLSVNQHSKSDGSPGVAGPMTR